MRNLHTKKCQLSSGLEQLMDRVNNKVKKDTDDFRYELELENPGCTYEFEKSRRNFDFVFINYSVVF